MIRVVLDTTVLVSAVISPTGPNSQVFELITDDKIRPYVTEAVIEEYYRVFEYERLQHLDKRRIALLRAQLLGSGITVKSGGRLKLSGHEEDNRIYECADAAKAHYIITENTKHFKKPYKITKNHHRPPAPQTPGRWPDLIFIFHGFCPLRAGVLLSLCKLFGRRNLRAVWRKPEPAAVRRLANQLHTQRNATELPAFQFLPSSLRCNCNPVC